MISYTVTKGGKTFEIFEDGTIQTIYHPDENSNIKIRTTITGE